MLVLPPQSYLGWKVSISIMHAIVAGTTIYRLVHRFQFHRAWWDDYLVTFPLVLNIVYCLLAWFRFAHRVVDTSTASQAFRVLNSYWLSLLPYQLSIWSSKAVLALSLARIFPKGHGARRWSYWLVIMIYETTHCATGNGRTIFSIIFLVMACIFGDILLIGSPLALFWRVKLPPIERRLVLAVFCGSIFTLVSAIISAILFINDSIFPGEDYILILIGFCNIDAAISLFVCNLTILTTAIYRMLRRQHASRNAIQETMETSYPASQAFTSSERPTDFSSTSEAMRLTEISTSSSLSQTRYTEWSNVTGDIFTSTISYKSEQ
ncbi:hypothetical protein CPB84DRAFT_1846622 [Gymnopilus junonius]|uniref:Rhodopsin domain-containing protein n=1 Tax=Gymnopilus junonius TaxID=109634 RepID=A0A9P5TNQ4_GYMJU|nr:hypothetical protein CPB84DRAFT_1846622 [Gymnopilus junonius]